MTTTIPPILRDVPQRIETARLVLRPPRAGDGAAVHAAVVDSLAELRTWPASLPWAVHEPSVDASETFCRESGASCVKRSALTYLAFERDSNALAVSASLHRIDWAVPKFEVGFWCRTSLHRRGYAAEAVGAMIAMALDSLQARRIDCLTDEANHAGRALCLRLSMQLEGVLRNERRDPDGTLRNTCVYAITV